MNAGVTIIAEIGENHLGDMDRACRMISEAARGGATMVKFQSYRGQDVAPDDPEREWFSQVELSDEDHRFLQARAEQEGVGFLSSPFTVERARLLCEGLGLKTVKIASSEMLNEPLLDYVNEHAETVYLSTGMATIEEIQVALSHLRSVRRRWVLHCTTQYPAQPEDANLKALPTLRTAFPDCGIGFSDHTIGITAAIAAVALGATVIEKHFTLDKTLPGTDHVLSVTPEELTAMVRAIRELEVMLGSGVKGPVSGEARMKEQVRSRFPKSSLRSAG